MNGHDPSWPRRPPTIDKADGKRRFLARFNMTGERRATIVRVATIGWFVALIGIVAWVVFNEQDDLRATFQRLKSADLSWIGVAVLIQTAMLVISGLMYKLVLRRLGYPVPLLKMVDAHLQRTTISTLTPGGGPGSVYIFVRNCLQLGVPAEDGFLAIAVRALGVAITFVAVLIPGAALGRSKPGALIAIIGLVVLVISGLALWKGERDNWETPLRWSRKLPGWAATRVQGFLVRFRDHGLRPDDLISSILLALGVRITIIGVLWACLHALGQDPSLGTILRTYFASILASTVIPVFGGAGAVEAVSILT